MAVEQSNGLNLLYIWKLDGLWVLGVGENITTEACPAYDAAQVHVYLRL